jgi:sec-independent protein translocase protein TatC
MTDDVKPTAPADEKETPAPDQRDAELGGRMSFIQHLEEFRRRIVISLATLIVCFVVVSTTSIEYLRDLFTQPLQTVLGQMKSNLIYTGMTEGFTFDLKLGAVTAVFISSPMLFYQIWAFVAPGLYKKEKKFVLPFIFFSTFLFLSGAAFFYFVVFPAAAQFFGTFAKEGAVQWMPKLGDVFSFVMWMLVAFGAIFEMPLVVFILARLNIVSAGLLHRNRKYAIVVILILAAVITPTTDFLNMMLLAIPMWVLFEISVVVAWIFGPKAKKEQTQQDGAGEGPPA